jgi:predicted TIM-barrel fold metal-dependent hydrolase
MLFASDHPFLSMERATEAARALPLSPVAMSDFMGDTALRLLRRP